MKPFLCYKLLLSALLATFSAASEPIFNGKDLSNWETKGKAIWRVENGIVHGGQDGDPKKSGLLVTKESYQDFELTFEFKIDEHGKYNSGVYFRLNLNQKAPRLQLNLGRGVADEPVGLYLNDWLDKGDEKDTFRKANEWNQIRLRVIGAHVEAWLNGHQIVDYHSSEELKNYLQPGKIAFQTYGAEGHAGWVKFRGISVKGSP